MQSNNYFDKRPLKIVLGDLRHQSAGKHSSFMPLGIGSIASYTLSQIDNANDVQFSFYTDPDKILQEIQQARPNVIGLANYCWNTELSRVVFKQAKKMNNKVICIAGGPNFPTVHQECEAYLLERPEIDLYVYFEGERVFAELIKKILAGVKLEQLKNEPQPGVMAIHSEKNFLVAEAPMPRITNMDEIPSPYLNGLMDQWFDGSFAPFIQTARGCPFTCAYCFVGNHNYFRRVSFFNVDRVKQDLDYIAKRMSKYPYTLLALADDNFGMFERDEEIGYHLKTLREKYGWPNVFDINTGKVNYDRILRISGLLGNKMAITSSAQSFNPATLDIIKRKNLTLEQYKELSTEIKKQGMRSTTEMIAPMPGETKESFFKGLKTVSNIIGVDRVISYTLMLLRGTYLASEECREKYQYTTKFRILPRQFGEYGGEKCFDIEEVCVATNTMSFDDYLETRGFILVLSLFMDNQFDIVHRHLKELAISNYDYFEYLWQMIKSGKSSLSDIYNQFIEETKNELWDSPQALYDCFNQEKNYQRLLQGELGDNLLRKYKAKVFFSKCAPTFELAYEALLKMIQKTKGRKIFEQVRASLLSAKEWAIALRDVDNVFHIDIASSGAIDIKTINLSYDVARWYNDGVDSLPLLRYKKTVACQISLDRERIKRILQEARQVFGGDAFFQASKLLNNREVKDFWRSYKEIVARKKAKKDLKENEPITLDKI